MGTDCLLNALIQEGFAFLNALFGLKHLNEKVENHILVHQEFDERVGLITRHDAAFDSDGGREAALRPLTVTGVVA
ncbi:hypothetical protein D9M71_601120 [compost metagenome]